MAIFLKDASELPVLDDILAAAMLLDTFPQFEFKKFSRVRTDGARSVAVSLDSSRVFNGPDGTITVVPLYHTTVICQQSVWNCEQASTPMGQDKVYSYMVGIVGEYVIFDYEVSFRRNNEHS